MRGWVPTSLRLERIELRHTEIMSSNKLMNVYFLLLILEKFDIFFLARALLEGKEGSMT